VTRGVSGSRRAAGAATQDNGVVTRADEVAAGLAAVRARIDAAARKAGRTDHVDLVVVTKTFPATDVRILAALGVTDVAENRDQEARQKRVDAEDHDGPIQRWHMIGQLQRNKAASVARWADVVESVDRPELVDALERGARAADRRLGILLQVALDPQPRPDRGGVDPRHADDLAARVGRAEGLELLGVMGVAPYPGDPDDAFARLMAVSEEIRRSWPGAGVVSAGMSGDLEQAVAAGATQVRVGGAVLGARPAVQ
jgi:pyridoxal phosphate enzyme (YggS family)